MELLTLMAHSRETTEDAIMFFLQEIEGGGLYRQQSRLSPCTSRTSLRRLSRCDKIVIPDGKPRALVVDGKTLTYILDRRSKLKIPFLRLTRFVSLS